MNFLKKLVLPLLTAAFLTGGAIAAPVAHAKAPAAVTHTKASAKPAKKMPARDAKGRFISTKNAASPAPSAKPGKKLPPRDAKGRFMSTKASAKPAKKMPARDAKGRFISTKKAASPAPSMKPSKKGKNKKK
jgi:hypothetical protein